MHQLNTFGLNTTQAELKRWDTPRREGGLRPDGYEAFPTMLYRAIKLENGKVITSDPYACQKVVGNESELRLALGQGWQVGPQEAREAFEAEEQALGQAAAERAAADRRLSAPAQAEAQAVVEASPDHLGDIPVAPKKRGRPRMRPVS